MRIRKKSIAVMSAAMLLGAMQCVYAQSAAEVSQAVGNINGIYVHIGATDGSLEAKLATAGKGNLLIQGLSTSSEQTLTAQKTIAAANLTGLASVMVLKDFAELPYNDHVVNVAIADLDAPGAPKLEEVTRIVRPLGFAYIKQGGQWKAIKKPMPKEMDEWGHYDRGADGNPNSTDSIVAAPKGLQWYSSNGGGGSGSDARLAGGRYFKSRRISGQQSLVGYMWARDAFNGNLEWRVLDDGVERGPRERMLVATDQILTGIIGTSGHARVLDAKTGAEKLVLTEGLEQPKKLRYGSVTDVLRSVTMQQILMDDRIFQAFEDKAVGLDFKTGKRLWDYTAPTGEFVAYIIGGEGRVYLALTKKPQRIQIGYGNQFSLLTSIVGLDAASGKQLWSTEVTTPKDPHFCAFGLIYYKGGVFAIDSGHRELKNRPGAFGNGEYQDLIRLNAADGKLVFRRDLSGVEPKDDKWHHKLRIQNGYVVPTFDNVIRGFDVNTGADGPEFFRLPKDNWGYCLVFCSVGRGTANGQVGGKFARFADFRDGIYSSPTIAKNGCQEGQYPGYGFIYAGGDGCGCTTFLRGDMALQGSQDTSAKKVPTEQRLQKGVAVTLGAADDANAWPMLLADTARASAVTKSKPTGLTAGKLAIGQTIQVPVTRPGGNLGIDWDEDNLRCGTITPPVISGDLLVVASTDAHMVLAYDSNTLKPRWSYQAGSRVTSSPTLHRGLVLFGSNDGYVTCLRASDGAVAWRFFAAPNQRQIMSTGQLESLWPVHGSVMVHEGKVFVTAGRLNQVDGGLFLYRLNLLTGQQEATSIITDQVTNEVKPCPEPKDDAARCNDILTTNAAGSLLYCGPVAIDPKTLAWVNLGLVRQSANPRFKPNKKNFTGFDPTPFFDKGPNLSWNTPGLLTFIFAPSTGTVDRRVSFAGQKGQNGFRLLAHSGQSFGIGGERIARDGRTVYILFNNELYKREMREDWLTSEGGTANMEEAKKNRNPEKLAVVGGGVVAMVVGPDVIATALNNHRFKDFRIQVFSKDGKKLGEMKLPSPIGTHGLVIANGTLYASLDDGRVITVVTESP